MSKNLDLGESISENAVKDVIKQNGQLVIPLTKGDLDKKDNPIGDYSHLDEIVKWYTEMFNPGRLSCDDYRDAYLKKELHWQKNG